MPRMTIISRDGEERQIEGRVGLSLMENIREAGFDEMLALCGGCCSCATCHVQIDPGTVDGLPDMSKDESDLLDSSDHRTRDSRLSCQVIFGEQMDGIRLKIAPED